MRLHGTPTFATADVLTHLSSVLGREILEHTLEQLLRRRRDLRPPVHAGRRTWRPVDVQRVEAAMREQHVGGTP